MLIQGDLFTDYYISDSIIAECRHQLLSIPEVVSVEVDPDFDTDFKGDFILHVFVIQMLGDRFNDLHREVKAIEAVINSQLANTKIYLLVDVSNEQTANMLWYRKMNEHKEKILADISSLVEEASEATFAEAEEITEQLRELQANMIKVLDLLTTHSDDSE